MQQKIQTLYLETVPGEDQRIGAVWGPRGPQASVIKQLPGISVWKRKEPRDSEGKHGAKGRPSRRIQKSCPTAELPRVKQVLGKSPRHWGHAKGVWNSYTGGETAVEETQWALSASLSTHTKKYVH